MHKQGDNSHSCLSYREFFLVPSSTAALSKMNCAGKTWAQILMLPLRKCTQSHLQSLRLKGPLLTPLPWNSRTRTESFSFLSSPDLNCKVHCSRELMLLNDHYRALVEIIDCENTDRITGKSLMHCQKISLFLLMETISSWLTLQHPTAFPSTLISKFRALYKLTPDL